MRYLMDNMDVMDDMDRATARVAPTASVKTSEGYERPHPYASARANPIAHSTLEL